MDRRTRTTFAVLLGVIVVLTGGAALLLGGSSARDPDLPAGTNEVVGIILAIDSRGLSDVRSFSLRTTQGQVYEFDLAKLQNGTEFPPGHLAEHQATSAPIRVRYREQSGLLEALVLQDAS